MEKERNNEKSNKSKIVMIAEGIVILALLGSTIFFAVSANKNNPDVSQLETKINSLEDREHSLVEQITELNGKISDKNQEIDKLNEDLEKKSNSAAQLEAEVYYKRMEINEKDAQIETLTSEKTSLQTQVSELNTLKDAQQSSITTLNQEKSALNNQITALNNEKTYLQTQVSNLTQSDQMKDSQITNLNSQITTLNSQISQLTFEKTNLENQVQTLTSSNGELQNQITSLNTQVTSLNSQLTTLTTEKNSLTAQVSQLTTEKTNLQTQVTTLTNEKTSLQNQVTTLQGQVSTLTSQLETMTTAANTYTVFYVYGDQIKGSASVQKGNDVQASDIPAVPTKENYLSRWEPATNVQSDKVIFPEFVECNVVLSSNKTVGQTLTATVTGAASSLDLTYTWTENVAGGGTNSIANTGNTYVIASANKGNTISVSVSVEGYAGSVSATSATISNGLTGTVTISESTDGVLVANFSNSSSYTLGTDYEIQWEKVPKTNLSPIVGTSYTVDTNLDLGSKFKAKVVGLNDYAGSVIESEEYTYCTKLTGDAVFMTDHEMLNDVYIITLSPGYDDVTYTWYVDGVVVQGETGNSYMHNGAGTITCKITGNGNYVTGEITVTEFGGLLD